MFQAIQQNCYLCRVAKELAVTRHENGNHASFQCIICLLLTLIVSRTTDASTSGQFFFLFNLVSLTAIISQRGFDVALVRFNAIAFSNGDIQQQSDNYWTALTRSITFCFMAAVTLFVGFYLFQIN